MCSHFPSTSPGHHLLSVITNNLSGTLEIRWWSRIACELTIRLPTTQLHLVTLRPQPNCKVQPEYILYYSRYSIYTTIYAIPSCGGDYPCKYRVQLPDRNLWRAWPQLLCCFALWRLIGGVNVVNCCSIHASHLTLRARVTATCP